MLTRQHFEIFQKAGKGLLLQSSISCNERSRNLAIFYLSPRLSAETFHMVYSYILHNCKRKSNITSFYSSKTGVICHHKKTNTHNRSYLSLLCIKNKRGNRCSFFFCKISLSIVPNIEKIAIQQTVLEQTTVVVKQKFIKCKQSFEGSIISQILKLPYSNGESDVNEMEIIQ